MAKSKTVKESVIKDRLYAKIAFYLSFGFFVPLFNIGFCVTSIIFALIAIRKELNEPSVYGGRGYAIAALIISITALTLTTIGGILYLLSDRICLSAICQAVVP